MNVEALIAEHEGYARSLATKAWMLGGFHAVEREDVEQEAMVGLWKAAKNYREGMGPQFRSYARSVIRDDISNFRKKTRSAKNCVLPRGAGLTREVAVKNDPSAAIEESEHADNLASRIWPIVATAVNGKEEPILRMVASGKSYDDIGRRLGMSSHRASAIASRARWKIRTRCLLKIRGEIAA